MLFMVMLSPFLSHSHGGQAHMQFALLIRPSFEYFPGYELFKIRLPGTLNMLPEINH